MLMHEWIKYRDRQLQQAESAADEEETEAAEEDTVNQRNEAVKLAQEVAERADEAQANRLQAIISRQQRLPLDVSESAEQESSDSSRGAKESRAKLVERLLDPTLTVSEAATLIGVCPTTVRRYTKRGVLNCFRTPGNQRRFRLSDVLDFIERQ